MSTIAATAGESASFVGINQEAGTTQVGTGIKIMLHVTLLMSENIRIIVLLF